MITNGSIQTDRPRTLIDFAGRSLEVPPNRLPAISALDESGRNLVDSVLPAIHSLRLLLAKPTAEHRIEAKKRLQRLTQQWENWDQQIQVLLND